jgi:hypothetical protein
MRRRLHHRLNPEERLGNRLRERHVVPEEGFVRARILPIVVLAGIGALARADEPAVARGGRGSTGDRKVVLLELYSSQGCSSCPPAEEFLLDLTKKGFPLDRVVPAAFHVDYWDRLGWKDPFSDARWTKRQHDVGTALKQESLYTPELVWDGRGHGSAPSDASTGLERALRAKPRASLELSAELTAECLAVKGTATPAKGQRLDADLALEVLVLEDGLETKVTAGENKGRTLRETAVVRDQKTALTLAKDSSDPVKFEASFQVPGSWKRDALHVAAVLRAPKTATVWQALDVALVASTP